MADIRVFQVIVPLVALVFIGSNFSRYRKGARTLGELLLAIMLWIGIGIFSIFPDRISRSVAELFGIADNVNAILFFGIGVLFFFQLKLYSIFKRQQRDLTSLGRDIALREFKKKEE